VATSVICRSTLLQHLENYAGIIESGNRLDFPPKSKWILKGNCDSNTYLTVKIGFGVDHTNDADSTNAQYVDASDSVGSTRTWEISQQFVSDVEHY
jgi:hypothetical protein